ncbi:hypothetical protein GALMADRAFT_249481 [Galerina marginata CBS 339.88]|uniref:Uncharacterized protein n=1 Tax=Galerina marginata (strain CBS 339.88) TaxID=685588 RepID=A0A067SX08_GALM3|nr:hypothetical protein GALMADRAFT_249481 [Galerina marginata CBS 339.88]
MAFCQTWASTSSHIRHPWFDTTIMKRKHRETVSPDEDVETQSASHLPGPGAPAARPAVKAPPLKKRRYSNLENGFAQMSLGAVASVTPSLPVIMDADMSTVPLAYTEPSIPEVKMKTSSWYEPEPDRTWIC